MSNKVSKVSNAQRRKVIEHLEEEIRHTIKLKEDVDIMLLRWVHNADRKIKGIHFDKTELPEIREIGRRYGTKINQLRDELKYWNNIKRKINMRHPVIRTVAVAETSFGTVHVGHHIEADRDYYAVSVNNVQKHSPCSAEDAIRSLCHYLNGSNKQ